MSWLQRLSTFSKLFTSDGPRCLWVFSCREPGRKIDCDCRPDLRTWAWSGSAVVVSTRFKGMCSSSCLIRWQWFHFRFCFPLLMSPCCIFSGFVLCVLLWQMIGNIKKSGEGDDYYDLVAVVISWLLDLFLKQCRLAPALWHCSVSSNDILCCFLHMQVFVTRKGSCRCACSVFWPTSTSLQLQCSCWTGKLDLSPLSFVLSVQSCMTKCCGHNCQLRCTVTSDFLLPTNSTTDLCELNLSGVLSCPCHRLSLWTAHA